MSGKRPAYGLNYKNLVRGAEFFNRVESVKVSIKYNGLYRICVYDEETATFLWRGSEVFFDKAVTLFKKKLLEVQNGR